MSNKLWKMYNFRDFGKDVIRTILKRWVCRNDSRPMLILCISTISLCNISVMFTWYKQIGTIAQFYMYSSRPLDSKYLVKHFAFSLNVQCLRHVGNQTMFQFNHIRFACIHQDLNGRRPRCKKFALISMKCIDGFHK